MGVPPQEEIDCEAAGTNQEISSYGTQVHW